jgi:hypothetical protein
MQPYREDILAENEVTLPEMLSHIKIQSEEECNVLVLEAKTLYRCV